MSDERQAPTDSTASGAKGEIVETFTYLCTSCPLGCRLEVDAVGDDVIEVRGFGCKRGMRYGTQEHQDPRRAVSTTVWLHGGPMERLPVRASEPVPKDRATEFVAALAGLVVEAPVAFGAVLATDVAGTGIDLVATREVAGAPSAGVTVPSTG
jgi:CxxC motif-containing protein